MSQRELVNEMRRQIEGKVEEAVSLASESHERSVKTKQGIKEFASNIAKALSKKVEKVEIKQIMKAVYEEEKLKVPSYVIPANGNHINPTTTVLLSDIQGGQDIDNEIGNFDELFNTWKASRSKHVHYSDESKHREQDDTNYSFISAISSPQRMTSDDLSTSRIRLQSTNNNQGRNSLT
jgi:hypothetical protein